MNEQKPVIGGIYRHFKGNLYQVVNIAYHSETLEEMVVYHALYGEYKHYVRPLKNFIEKLDKTFYPDASQKFRFELVTDFEKQSDNQSVKTQDSDEFIVLNDEKLPSKQTSPVNKHLMAFLDAESYKDKILVLKTAKDYCEITPELLRDVAVSLDCVVEATDIDIQYETIIRFLMTKSKFECGRLR